MAPILCLPDELLDRVCLCAARRDLWALTQTCSVFRRIGTRPYLAHFGVSHSVVESGILSLSDSFFLILVVGRVKPIQRLICFENPERGQSGYPKLAVILSSAAPIPDIVIYNRYAMSQRARREASQLLGKLPAVTDSLLVVASPMQTWLVSRPRRRPPIRWKLLPPPFGRTFRTRTPTSMRFIILVFGVPLMFAYLVSAVTNLVVLLLWLYDIVSGKPWTFQERLKEDVGTLSYSHCIRIQTLLDNLILVTLTDRGVPELGIRDVPGLDKEQFAAVLRALSAGPDLRALTLLPDLSMPYPDLLDFLARHPSLELVKCWRESIQVSSLPLASAPAPPTGPTTSKIVDLRAPVSYLPHLLPLAPNVRSIWFTQTDVTSTKRSRILGGSFDVAAYRAALDRISALPGTYPIRLVFTLRAAYASLPWTSTDDASPAPETRLSRVTELVFYTSGGALLHAQHLLEKNAFARWLARFPALVRVTFAPGVVHSEWLGEAQRAVLEGEILRLCEGLREFGAGAIVWNVRPGR